MQDLKDRFQNTEKQFLCYLWFLIHRIFLFQNKRSGSFIISPVGQKNINPQNLKTINQFSSVKAFFAVFQFRKKTLSHIAHSGTF